MPGPALQARAWRPTGGGALGAVEGMNEVASCFPKTPKRAVVNSTDTTRGVLTPDTKSSKYTCAQFIYWVDLSSVAACPIDTYVQATLLHLVEALDGVYTHRKMAGVMLGDLDEVTLIEIPFGLGNRGRRPGHADDNAGILVSF